MCDGLSVDQVFCAVAFHLCVGLSSYTHIGLTSRHCSNAEVNLPMNIIHDFHDNNSLDCLMTPAYIFG
jgi:hypothetical protein